MNKKLTVAALIILSISILITSYPFISQVSGKLEKNDNLKQVFLKYENKTVYFDGGRYVLFNLKEIGDDFIKLENVANPSNRTNRPEIIYLPFSSIKSVDVSDDAPRIVPK